MYFITVNTKELSVFKESKTNVTSKSPVMSQANLSTCYHQITEVNNYHMIVSGVDMTNGVIHYDCSRVQAESGFSYDICFELYFVS